MRQSVDGGPVDGCDPDPVKDVGDHVIKAITLIDLPGAGTGRVARARQSRSATEAQVAPDIRQTRASGSGACRLAVSDSWGNRRRLRARPGSDWTESAVLVAMHLDRQIDPLHARHLLRRSGSHLARPRETARSGWLRPRDPTPTPGGLASHPDGDFLRDPSRRDHRAVL